MWDKSKFDFEEEEYKVRKSLSRLIHTLQHFPSKRTRLDNTSLWNLVDDLESFNPHRKAKSMHFTQTTERKTYSKKSVNLQISGENNTSPTTVPGYCKTAPKLQHGKPDNTFSHGSNRKNYSHFKGKGDEEPKIVTSYACNPNKDMTIKKNNGQLKSIGVRGKKNEKNTTFEHKYVPRKDQKKAENIILQNKNKKDALKDQVKNMDKDKRRTTNTFTEMSYKKQQNRTKNQTSYMGYETNSYRKNQNQVINFKCKSNQCTPKPNKALEQIILEDNQPSGDRYSVVRKLTNYWNNLLNNEFYQSCSTTESSGESCQNVQSLDHFTQEMLNENESFSGNWNSTLKTRHMSESNINIMKRVEYLHSKHFSSTEQNSGSKNMKPGSLRIDSSVKLTNNNCPPTLENQAQTKDVMENLQNIFSALKSFSSCNITSDKITLPQSLAKKMLYIIASFSTSKSHDDTFLKKLENYSNEIIEEILGIEKNINKGNSKIMRSLRTEQADATFVGNIFSPLKNNLDIEMYCVNKEKSNDISTIPRETPETSMALTCSNVVEPINKMNKQETQTSFSSGNALVISRINMNNVKNAVKLFMMWKDIMWSNSYNFEDIVFSNNCRPESVSFTIIYEEDIILEEESDEDVTEVVSEDECQTNINVCTLAAMKIEKYIDKLIDILENYWPDCPEVLLRMVYQSLVSILIWWVIVKEIFVK